ncbi:MAG: hypothetical protein ACI8X5_002398 [Planctomycetota bacterium]|jgi:hypothetical protein
MYEELSEGRGTRKSVHVGLCVLLLGVAGDLLMRAHPWGLNLALMTVLAFTLLGLIVRVHRVQLSGTARFLLGVAATFGLCSLWRDAWELQALSLCILLSSLGLAARSELAPGWLPRTRLGSYLKELFNSLFGVCALPARTLPGLLGWIREGESGPRRHLQGIVRGLVMAATLFALFGFLFAAADEKFAKAAQGLLVFDVEEIASHTWGLFIWSWVSAAFFLQILWPRYGWKVEVQGKAPGTSRALELNLSLALLNGLFLSFVAIQLSYFFGGHGHVLDQSQLTYAEYARRGFFELAWVAGLALVVLLVWESYLGDCGRAATITFRCLGITLIGLVMIIIASAMHRMSLYTEAYGLTTMRLYVSAFMIWMVCVLGWFAFTVLRGQAERFPPGFLVSGWLAVLLLFTINPDGVVARHNIERFVAGRALDHVYLQTLSADAVPALLEGASSAPGAELTELLELFVARPLVPDGTDWRSWNWGLFKARAALMARDE